MKPTLIRRFRNRNTSSRSEATIFKKDNQETFFGNAEQSTFFPPAATIQRKCDHCEEEEKKVQRVEDKEEEKVMKMEDKKEDEKIQRQPEKKEEEKVQKKESSATSTGSKNISNYIGSLNGKGQPLSPSANYFFSSRMGYDFSNVKVHTDKEASESAKGINAKAYTIGNNIVFKEGQYNTESSEGKKLVAHELTHVVQQKMDESKIKRTPDFMGVFNERYSYSTNCGWIDWGHANPTLARNLIAIIRETSKRMQRKKDALRKKIASEMPKFIVQDKCGSTYGKDEKKNSFLEAPIVTIFDSPSGAVEIRMGGFGVGSFDPSKFKKEIEVTTSMILQWPAFKGVLFDLKMGGFTDCVGKDELNSSLRNSRASAIAIEMARAAKGQTVVHIPFNPPLNEFLADNTTAAGRKINRGVVLQLIPYPKEETAKTPTMGSSAIGLTLSEVTPTVALHRPLSESEINQAALTTFMLQSIFFEAVQAWTDFIGGSSYSEEDLVSNLIGFYRAAEGYSVPDIKGFCDVWDRDRSFQKFANYSFQKNQTFRPLSLPPGGSWPAELKSIRPMSLNAENFSILSLFIKPSFMAPGKCQINPDNTITCS